jgi:uncharacterized protein
MSITVKLPDKLGALLNEEATRQSLTADELAARVLAERYADQHLGGVDAGLVAIAERLGLTAIATLDRRHFGVVRPSHSKALTLLP